MIDLPLVGEGLTAEIYAWGPGQVLKLYRPAFSQVAAREFRILEALASSDLNAPRPIRQVELEGRSGYLMARIVGASLKDRLEARPDQAELYAASLGELHAAVHASPPGAWNRDLESLAPRVVATIERRRASLGQLTGAVEVALASVGAGDALCHNDFHFGNVMQGDDGFWIIDWNGAGIADPHADLAKSVVLMKHAPAGVCFGPRVHAQRHALVQRYLAAYAARRPIGPAALNTWQTLRAAELICLGVSFADSLMQHITQLLMRQGTPLLREDN